MTTVALVLAVGWTTWRYLAAARQVKHLQDSRLEFLARLSHELGTPLAAISGRVHGLQDNVFPPETRGQHLAKLSHETALVSVKMKRLLELSRWESGGPELAKSEFTLLEPLMEAVDAVEDLMLAHGMQLRFEGVNSLLQVSGDRGRVRELIQILLENTFSPQARVTIKVTRQGNRAAVAVSGIGGELNELGLAVARRLATAHGGVLELARSWTCFTLPIVKESPCVA